MRRDGKNLVQRLIAELLIEQHVGKPGPGDEVVDRHGNGANLRRDGNRPDANVAKATVPLGGAGAPERLPSIGNDSDVGVRVNRPGLKRAKNLLAPGGLRCNGVERRRQRAGLSGSRHSVCREAQREMGIEADQRTLRIQGEPLLEPLQVQGASALRS